MHGCLARKSKQTRMISELFCDAAAEIANLNLILTSPPHGARSGRDIANIAVALWRHGSLFNVLSLKAEAKTAVQWNGCLTWVQCVEFAALQIGSIGCSPQSGRG